MRTFSLLLTVIAMLADLGQCRKPKGNTVLGVDLGGNYMKAAYVAPGEEDPFPILLSDLSERKATHAVAFRRGKWLFGTHASKAAISNPDSTFLYYGSHLLGRQFSNPEVTYYRSMFPAPLEADPVRGTVLVKDANGKVVPVEFLSALYLENLKEHAQSISDRNLSGVVLTVPAYYDQLQRRALLEAAEVAGVKVYAMINPASAAAIYYGTQVYSGAGPQYALVFDSGATGTSAVIAQIDPAFKQDSKTMASIEIKAVASEQSLSGHNIDARLARLMASRFEAENPGVKVTVGRSMNRLLNEANRVKHVLSANSEILTGVEDLVDEVSFSSKVSRDELEAACADMVTSIDAVIGAVLEKAKLTLEDIAIVIPVGGNSRVPFVLSALKSRVGEGKVSQTLNAEEAASKGATLYAAQLYGNFRLKPFRFKDALPSGLQLDYEAKVGATEPKSVELYPAGTSLLESHKGISLRNMDDVELRLSQLPGAIPLYQATVKEFNEAVAKFAAEKILDSKIKVWFDIDRTGIFRVAPPVALIQLERMVEEKKTSTATATTTTSASTTEPSTTATAVPPVLVPTKFTETVPLKHEIIDMVAGVGEASKAEFVKEISKYRADLLVQMQRAGAKNDLESAFYSIRGQLDSEEFTRWFKEGELDALRQALTDSHQLIEEDRPELALADFKAPLDKLSTIQASAILRRDEFEKRQTIIPAIKKSVDEVKAYSDNTLHVFEPEKRAQTNEELESLMKDALELESSLEQKLEAQSALPFNEDPVFKCAEFSAKLELLQFTMKMLKKKVLPKPPVTTVADQPADPTSGASPSDATPPPPAEHVEEPAEEISPLEHPDL